MGVVWLPFFVALNEVVLARFGSLHVEMYCFLVHLLFIRILRPQTEASEYDYVFICSSRFSFAFSFFHPGLVFIQVFMSFSYHVNVIYLCPFLNVDKCIYHVFLSYVYFYLCVNTTLWIDR